MSSQPPLTPAEKAAREALSEWETFTASDGNTSIRMREARSEDELARAVVAAVWPHIEAEVLDLSAGKLEGLAEQIRRTHAAAQSNRTGLVIAAQILRERLAVVLASLPLSRPTAKETP